MKNLLKKIQLQNSIIILLILVTIINIAYSLYNRYNRKHRSTIHIEKNSLSNIELYSTQQNKNILFSEINKKKIAILLMHNMFCLSCKRNFQERLKRATKQLEQLDCSVYIVTSILNKNFIFRVLRKYKIKYKDFLLDNNNSFFNKLKPEKVPAIAMFLPEKDEIKLVYF